jgi:small subunit ribosomal protein S11e
MAEQNEKSFQKQPMIRGVHEKLISKKTPGKNGARWYKNVGLGIRTPKEAIDGTYIDKKCPFTGNVAIRGRILTGVVRSTKMKRTIVIRRDYLHFVTKYQRYEKRHKNLSAHLSPAFRCADGDTVVVGQCRPLSKTVRFNVLKVIPVAQKGGKSFGKF